MSMTTRYPRLNIYLDSPGLREKIKIGAARRGVTLSGYCLDAVRVRLQEDGLLPPLDMQIRRRTAAQTLDSLRQEIGPIAVPVKDLIAEGRR